MLECFAVIFYIKNVNDAKLVKKHTKLDNRIELLCKISYTVDRARKGGVLQ